MPGMADPQSSFTFDETWTTSGNKTVTHNLGLPTVKGSYAGGVEVIIVDGDCYSHTHATNSFKVYVTSTGGRIKFRPTVRVGDYPT